MWPLREVRELKEKGGAAGPQSEVEWMVEDLKSVLEGLVDHLFGEATPRRWMDDSFPFTSPSLQVEVQFLGRWMEVLGCGIIQPDICRHFNGGKEGEGREEMVGWAFGLGLERLAMILFDIPDIRLFWSEDPRFLSQFAPSTSSLASSTSPSSSPSFHSLKFSPFSKYPPCPKDLSFWLPSSSAADQAVQSSPSVPFHENDFYAVIRSVAGDWVESVRQEGEEFRHPTTGQRSRLYRVIYRSHSQSLTNAEVNATHQKVREALQRHMKLQLR